jgi:hypothetical protein
MIDFLATVKRNVSASAALIRADAALYLFIVLYTIAGLAFLYFTGAQNQAAYAIYVGKWLVLFVFFFPAVALLTDAAYVVRRFNKRRQLAFRRAFSTRRLARFFSGLVLLQAMILFQGTFTSVKNALSVWWGGFPYDRIQADIDKALHFGADPWQWLYAIAGYDWVRTLVEWNYNLLWFVLCFGALFYVATSPGAQSIRLRYILAFMAVWIVVGNLLAGSFLSAGPAFYGLTTGDEARFAAQLEFLARSMPSPNSAAAYQNYLWELHAAGKTGFGSGISAFPSVHVGLITMNALFISEYSRRLGYAAFGYVTIIIASSVYLGWHYAIDGYVAVAAAIAIHFFLKRAFAERAAMMMTEALDAPAAASSARASHSFLSATSSTRWSAPLRRMRSARGRVGRMFSRRFLRLMLAHSPSAMARAASSDNCE